MHRHELPEGIESVELEGEDAENAWRSAEISYADTEPAPFEPTPAPNVEPEELLPPNDFWRDSEFGRIE